MSRINDQSSFFLNIFRGIKRPPSGVREGGNGLFFVREFGKMKKNVREFGKNDFVLDSGKDEKSFGNSGNSKYLFGNSGIMTYSGFMIGNYREFISFGNSGK